MPELPGMPSSIRCPSCGFENTTTSLYCQDCGVRLVAPPSALAEQAPPEPAAGGYAGKAKSQPRIISVNRPNRIASFLVITFRTLILAALAALIFFLVRAPADVPPTAPPLASKDVDFVRAALQRNAQTGRPFEAEWDRGLNAYLAAVLPEKTAIPGLAFERVLLAPVTGGLKLFIERKVGKLTLYGTVTYRLVSRGNGIGVEPTDAAFGRLPLPAWAAPVIFSMSGGLDQTLSPELDLLRGARNVRVTPEKVFVDFGPPSP